MINFHHLLSLLVCLACLSGATGAGKDCAVLHNQPNFQGSTYAITSRVQLPTIQDERIEDAYHNWNTKSISITNNCTLVACPDRYFRGKCQELNQSLSNVTSVNVAAVKCDCQEDCDSSHGPFREAACARAYLGSHCEMYVDFTSSPSFSESLASEISSIQVKKGCSLTIYDEEEYEGDHTVLDFDSASSLESEWRERIRSYSCQCTSTPTEVIVDTPSTTNGIAQLELPESIDALSGLINGQYKGHKGLEAALESAKHRRSPKNAYILVLGTTGSGKSSLINLLLNQNLTKAGDAVSTTSSILEFHISTPIPELGITNSEIRVIDTPGLGDTRGLEEDARFLASLDKYLSSHPELSHRIPNAVLIVHPYKDNRISGKGSKFIKMLRGLDHLRNRIMDDSYSNVVFVLTHFMSVSLQDELRNPWNRIQEFKQVVEDHAVFPKPISIVVAENKGQEMHLPMKQGNFVLPNGDLYPHNLISKIKIAMRNGGDALGNKIVTKAFDLKAASALNVTEIETALLPPDDPSSNGTIREYFDILTASELNIDTTEVSKLLSDAAKTLDDDLLRKYPGSLVYTQKALSTRGIYNVSDIPKTDLLVANLFSSLELNEVVETLLDKGLSIKAPTFRQELLVGKCYSFLRDTPLSESPIQATEAESYSQIGYSFPSTVSCIPQTTVVDQFRIFSNRQEYLESRRNYVGMTEEVNSGSFSGTPSGGNNIISSGQRTVTISAMREYRVFKLQLNTDTVNGSRSFLRDIQSLQPFNETNYESVQKWNNFFQKYGTHVVHSVFGGGSIEIKVTVNSSAVQSMGRRIFDFIDFADKIQLSDSLNTLNLTEHVLTFRGGDSAYKTTDLTKMTVRDAASLLGRWRKSLLLRPEIIPTSLSLIPLSQVVRKMSGNNLLPATAISEAASHLLTGALKYTPSKLILAELGKCKAQKSEADKKFLEQKSTIAANILEVKQQIAQRSQQMKDETSKFMKDLLVLQGEETQLKELEATKNEMLALRTRCEAHKMTVYKY